MDSELEKSQTNSHQSASIGTKYKDNNQHEVESDDKSNNKSEWDPDEQSQSKVSKSHIGYDRYKTVEKYSPIPKKPVYKRPLFDDSFNKNGQYMQRQFKLQRTSRRSVFQRKNLIVVKTIKQHLLDYWRGSIINRNNKYKLLYNYFYTTFTLVQCFYISIHISFGIQISELINDPALYVFVSLNLLDFFIQVNTDILVKGQEIRDRQTLLKEYIKRNYLEDVIPLLLFFLYYFIDYDTKYRYILLPFLIRMRKFSQLVKHFEESSTLDVKSYNVVQLIKLFFQIIFVSHFVTCFWIYEAKTIFIDINWMEYFKMLQYSWPEQYIRAYYFTIVTMCTVGYGDIYPINAFENIMSIFTMLIASGIFGYSINQIGSIFNQIQEYMERKKISSQLQYKIREYLDNFWREEMLIKTDNETDIVNMLNNSLKNDLFKETYFVTFQNSIFYEHFTSEVLTESIQYIKEVQCIPEQVIFSKGDQLDQSIYFVESGKVDLYIPDNKQITLLSTLKTGECFGTYSFFTNEDRTCFARSNGFSTILKINREDFINVLKNHSYDYEMFCHVKDKLLYAKEFGLIYDNCFKCEANNHLVYQCPKLHYCVDKKELIFREQLAEQKRDPEFYRSILRQQGFFRRKLYIEEGFLQLIDQKEDLIEEFEDQYLYGNMYEVYEEDLESEYQKQQTNNNQSIKNLQAINQTSTQQSQQQTTQSSQLSAVDKQQSALSTPVQISRTGSRELTRRIRARRLTSKEDPNDLNHVFMNNTARRKKSSKMSSTIVMSQQQQQALISQFQNQLVNQIQNQQRSMTSMNMIEEEKISQPTKPQSHYNENTTSQYHKAESIKDNRRTSIIQTPSEKSIQSHKQKQIGAPLLPPIPSSNLIISNLNNIINLLSSNNQYGSNYNNNNNNNNNNLYHVNFKNSIDQQMNQIMNIQNQMQEENDMRRDSYVRGNTSNYHNCTYQSRPNKQFSFNMEIDLMKIMKQYMIENNYPTVIESLNRVFMNDIRKTRKSSFKSRLKRIDIFLKNQEFKKSQSQKNIIKVSMFSRKGSLDDDDEQTHVRQEIQRSMSLDYVQDDKASRMSRLSQVSRLDITNQKGNNILSVNNLQPFSPCVAQPLDISKNSELKKNCNLNESSEEGTIMNVSSFYPQKPVF